MKASARTKYFAAGALAVGGLAFLAITAGGIGQNLVYYWGPTELRQAGARSIGATIRLGGQVAKGSLVQKPGVASIEFDVADGKETIHVTSAGVPPQMFREGIGVVVEGTMTKAGHFESRRLMVSHGNEYRSPDDPKNTDMKRLIQSTKGLDDPQKAP
jgi:cytochrome c-type biogenesis protein CcmE